MLIDVRIFSRGPGGYLLLIALVLLLAAVSSRLLGVRAPLRRAALTGFTGLFVGVLAGILVYYRGHPNQITALVVVTAVAAAVVSTMVLMVVAELLARPGRQELAGGLPRPWRAIRQSVQSTRRYAELSRIALRHGFGGFSSGSRADPGYLARSLRLALEESGPIFVKLGQVLSTRTDMLPEAVTTELAKLQDHVSPTPWPEIQAVLQEELAKDLGDVFTWVGPEPLATASLAQAHEARSADGSPLVLKVQRPGIAELVTRDLEMVRRITRRLESRAEWARSYHVADLGRGFADALTEELDFHIEASNIAAVATAAPTGSAVLIPTVHTDVSSRRLLVMDRFDGTNIRDAGPELDRAGADRDALARELLGCLLRQILVQGTFHADPHPGNVLFLRSGQLALIDFGSVGRLDVRQQAALQRLLLAVAQRDPTEFYEAVTELAVADARDAEGLQEMLTAFMTRHLGPGKGLDANLVRSMVHMLADAGAAFPPAIGGVFRALITLDGTLRILAPGFDLAAESKALARVIAGEQFTERPLRDMVSQELLNLLPMLRRLPSRVDRISAALAQGRFTINQRMFSDPHDVAVITGLVNRAVLGLLGSALGVMSVVLLASRGSPSIVSNYSPGARAAREDPPLSARDLVNPMEWALPTRRKTSKPRTPS